jgi:hypothetical protein
MTDQTSPKPFVFVLMPFKPAFDDIYQFGIRATCEAVGAYSERVDEQLYDGTVLARIYNQIAKADVVVADMTGQNANVFYEVGYAHALDRRVILLTQSASDIPFDFKHYPHVVYEGSITRLRDELTKRLRWALEHPAGDLARIGHALEFYSYGAPIEQESTVWITHTDRTNDDGYQFVCPIDFTNVGQRASEAVLHVGLVSADLRAGGRESTHVVLPDGNHMVMQRVDSYGMVPGLWDTTAMPLTIAYGGPLEAVRGDGSLRAIFRVFSELGAQDVPVLLRQRV